MLNNRNMSRYSIIVDTSYQLLTLSQPRIRRRLSPMPGQRDAWGQRARRQNTVRRNSVRNRAEARICAARWPQGPARRQAAPVADPGNDIAYVFHVPQPGPGGGPREERAGNTKPIRARVEKRRRTAQKRGNPAHNGNGEQHQVNAAAPRYPKPSKKETDTSVCIP